MKSLMPRSTAMWLIDNTSLTFEQIASFCGLHRVEVQALADGKVNIKAMNPIQNSQLTREEVSRCENDPNAKLQSNEMLVRVIEINSKKKTCKIRTNQRLGCISWLLKNCPDISNTKICKILGTTNSTVEKIRTGKHARIETIEPVNPISLNLCSKDDIEELYSIE